MLKNIRSERTESLLQSEIRAMTRACNEVGGINLGQGVCDVPAPDLVKKAASDALAADDSIYTRFDGHQRLREALANRFRHYNGLDYDAESEVVVTIGASGAFASTLMALCNPGDEIIIFEPYYGYHVNTARVAGLTPVIIPLRAPDFAVDANKVAEAITPRTRAILINTPVNPSGKLFSKEELEAIALLANKHDLLVITDEVYEYFLYDGVKHLSPATLPSLYDRTVTMGSYSKTFSITGWRIGFAAAPAPLAAAIGLVNDLYYVCSPAPLQTAVATGIEQLGDDYYAELRTTYQRKRDQFCGVLTEIGLTPIVPRGAYYVLADIKSLRQETSKEAAMKLLHEAGVASVPGNAFFSGDDANNLTRFCYAKQQNDLDRACEQLLAWGRTRS
jgi:aminotransferase